MAVRSIFSSVSNLATGAVDGPVRGIVEAILDERGFVSGTDFAAAQRRLDGLEDKLASLLPRVEAAEQRATHLAGEVQRLQSSVDDLTRDLADSRDQTIQAVARADEAEGRVRDLQVEMERLATQWAETQDTGTAAEAAPATVGSDGAVEVRGQRYYVDLKHAGEPYKVAHNGAVRVGARLVKKSAEPRS